MTETIWLARHGNREDFTNPDWAEAAERPHDPGLSTDGKEQAERLARRLADEEVDHLFASPFLRTVQTAHPIAQVLKLPIRLEPGLSEWMNEAWFDDRPTLLSMDALADRFSTVDPRYEPLRMPTFPETKEEMYDRVAETARTLAERYDGTMLIVGHGASVTGSLRGLMGEMVTREYALCALSRLTRDDGSWRMDFCNDVSHLDEATAGDRFN